MGSPGSPRVIFDACANILLDAPADCLLGFVWLLGVSGGLPTDVLDIRFWASEEGERERETHEIII